MAEKGGHWVKSAGGGSVFVEAGGAYEIVPANGRGQYEVLRNARPDSAGIRKTMATGTREDVERFVAARVKAERTRIANAANVARGMMENDVRRGFYRGIPLARLKGAERRYVAKLRKQGLDV
jgi:hypothetical protein